MGIFNEYAAQPFTMCIAWSNNYIVGALAPKQSMQLVSNLHVG